MKFVILLLFCFLCLIINIYCTIPPHVSLVDTRSGSGGFGFQYGSIPPGVQLPYSPMRLSPDTSADGIWLNFEHFSGYNYMDNTIRSFTHTHMVGAGVGDLGNFGVMPVGTTLSNKMLKNYGYGSKFNKTSEIAQPGYYAVQLEVPSVFAEFTPIGSFSAIHQYTFAKRTNTGSNTNALLFDICAQVSTSNNKKACKSADVTISVGGGNRKNSPNTQYYIVTGHILFAGALTQRADKGAVDIYFHAFIIPTMGLNGNEPTLGIWENDNMMSNTLNGSSTSGSLGAFIDFGPNANVDNVIQVYSAISFINGTMAELNNNFQQITKSSKLQRVNYVEAFLTAKTNAQAIWEERLSVIEVSGTMDGTESDIKRFYSLLYHSFLAPSAYNEYDNYYLGFDNIVHQWNYPSHPNGNPSRYYSDMSLWDIHRTQNPLLVFIAPEIAIDSIRSMYTQYIEGGDMSRWPLLNVYTGCMQGAHGLVSIVDWYIKLYNYENWAIELESLYSAVFNMVTSDRKHGGYSDYSTYAKLGYIPYELNNKDASATLEFNFDDGVIANWAKILNKTDDYNLLYTRSQTYKQLFSSTDLLMCHKHQTGELKCPSTLESEIPYPLSNDYTEADAIQNLWFVPHDIEGLISLFPNKESFVNKLSNFVEKSNKWIFAHDELPNSMYWAGNEPDILSVWLFNWAQRADLTNYYTRMLLKRRFDTENLEFSTPGNDDYGTISAWATWASIGLYPQSGFDNYIISAPIFEKITIHRASQLGGDLIMNVYNLTSTNYYPQTIELNGQALTSGFISNTELSTNGNTLTFTMGPNPVTNTKHETVKIAQQ